jgi:hypothetical protein
MTGSHRPGLWTRLSILRLMSRTMQTNVGGPSFSQWFGTSIATSTLIAQCLSVRERIPSPMTCLNLQMAASTRVYSVQQR